MADELEGPSETRNWKEYASILARRKWWFAIPAFAVWAALWMFSWLMPATYRSETVILVEQQKVPEQYVVPNMSSDLQDRLQSMTQQILSRTRLLAIIEEDNLYGSGQGKQNPDELVTRMRKATEVELVQAPNQRGELTAFKVAYKASDPAVAKMVTTQLTSLFINENLKVRQEQSEQTTSFLNSELESARQRLADQEGKVKEFKSQYLGQLPEQVQSNLQILSGLQAQLQQETDALGRAKQQGVYLESLLNQWRALEGDIRSGRTTAAGAPPALDQELQRLRSELTNLRSRYTEQHPDVRKLKDQIAKAEQLKRQMETSGAGDETTTALTASQTLSPRMEVESQLKSNKLEIENRQRSIGMSSRQVADYQARLNMTPVREQQLAALTRDYEQSRKNYDELLSKRDQSERATNLEKRQEGEQFRVLDPPNLPQKPYSPNRLKMSLIGLLGGLVAGFGVVVVVEALDDRIYTQEALDRVLPVPVLAEIPPLFTESEEHTQIRWRRMQRAILWSFAGCAAAGFAVSFLFG